MTDNFPSDNAENTVDSPILSAVNSVETLPELIDMPQEADQPLALEGLSAFVQDTLSAMQTAIESTHRTIAGLQDDFKTKIQYDQSKERTIDILHKQLQDYKDDLTLKILRPLVSELIRLYDDIEHLVPETARAEAESSPLFRQVINHVDMLRGDIESMLNNNGIESYSLDGDAFDSTLQRTVSIISTSIPEQDKTVAKRVRRGFRYEDHVLRHEAVIVYRYVQPVS